ncbi:hypothetical protein B5X24_HaOG201984 [Helicoverpa armigera]|uniref:Uncharacterized protein n=1 Tax=Helicoverpa armigera TaxID=29058 RepID=A0A2W1BZC7_HELAM|nr:hypothetical protein B5X24_HaOG201984 [Helicoverpa armigera]
MLFQHQIVFIIFLIKPNAAVNCLNIGSQNAKYANNAPKGRNYGLNVQCEDVIPPVLPNWRSFNLHIKRVEASIGHYERARYESHLVESGPGPTIVKYGPGLFTFMKGIVIGTCFM